MEERSNRIGRERILDVAEELFMESGYRAVSIRNIAHACEVTNAALYYHFPSKEALFTEVVERHAARLNERTRKAAMAGETPKEKTILILNEYARIVAEHRSPFFLLRSEKVGLRQVHQQRGRLMNAMLQPLDDVLNEAVVKGELQPLPEHDSPAALLVGMLHGLVQHRKACCQGEIGPQDIRRIVDILWSGLQQEPST